MSLEYLRRIQRPVREYNARFPDHPLKPEIHKWAVNYGHYALLEQALIEAVASGTPITDWHRFVTPAPRPSADGEQDART